MIESDRSVKSIWFNWWIFHVVFLTAVAGPSGLLAAAHTIRIAVFSDAGVTKAGVKQVERCLPESEGFKVKSIDAEQIRDGDLKNFDVLIHGGGTASKQAETLGDKGRDAVKKFVSDGGGFIGICAGAYLASAEYKWSLGVLDAQVIDGAHWARGEGDVKLRLTSAGQKALQPDKENVHDPFRKRTSPRTRKKGRHRRLRTARTFASEMRKNDAPLGIMKGTTAIARGKFGKGRIVCFSPHPEKTPGRETFLQSAVRWAAHESNNNPSRNAATVNSQGREPSLLKLLLQSRFVGKFSFLKDLVGRDVAAMLDDSSFPPFLHSRRVG